MPDAESRGPWPYRHPVANQLVLAVHAHRNLVAVMAFPVLPGPTGSPILLPPFGRTPVRRDGVLL